MKLLKDENYNALKADADNWQKVKAGIMKSNPDLKDEEITSELVLNAESVDTDEVTNLKEQIASLKNEMATKATEIANLQSKIAELKGTPAEPKQEITVKKEPTAEEENIEDFASKHEDDTLAIMQKAKEVGFF